MERLTAEQIFNKQKRKIKLLWDKLEPLQRSKVFRMSHTCLFVFHNWDELDTRQKDIVYNAVRIIIENGIVNQEVGLMVRKLKELMGKHLPSM